MKKFIISILSVIIILGFFNSSIYAASTTTIDGTGEGASSSGTSQSTKEDDGSWVSDAFSAASKFLNQGIEDDATGVDALDNGMSKILTFITNLVKGVNIVLLTALAGISMIALAIVGVRYILSGASPGEREKAKGSLHTVFTGMIYGFGAYIIWNIAMAIVRIVIGALA